MSNTENMSTDAENMNHTEEDIVVSKTEPTPVVAPVVEEPVRVVAGVESDRVVAKPDARFLFIVMLIVFLLVLFLLLGSSSKPSNSSSNDSSNNDSSNTVSTTSN
jgi:hypothetical protein